MANQKFINWQSALTQYREIHGVAKIPTKGTPGHVALRDIYEELNKNIVPTSSPAPPTSSPSPSSPPTPVKVRKTRAKKVKADIVEPLKIVIPIEKDDTVLVGSGDVPVQSEVEGAGLVVKPKRKPRVKKEVLVE